MFPAELPAELIILILSYLPLSSVSALSRLNREWYNFIQGNDMNRETIYRDVAFYEGFVPKSTMLLENLDPNGYGSDVRKALYSGRSMAGVRGWKDFCKKRKIIERAWAGRAPSRVIPSPRPPGPQGSAQTELKPEPMHYRRVHRIKVDEKVGITMATTQLGGLIVRDLETDVVLWELPVWYVRGYAHLEYGEGYLIFDRDDGNKEVWRRTAELPVPSSSSSTDTNDSTSSPTATAGTDSDSVVDRLSLPDERQRNVMNYISHLTSFSPHPSSTSATTTITTSSSLNADPPNAKARFTPHAVLHMPEPTRAFRFVYPHLLVASLERAFVWDVRIGKVVEIVEGIQVIQPNGGSEAGGEEVHAHEEEGEQGHEHEGEEQEDGGEGSSNLAASASATPAQAQAQGLGNVGHDLALLADIFPPPSHISSSTGVAYHEPQPSHTGLTSHPGSAPETSDASASASDSDSASDPEDPEEDPEEDDNHQPLPQFLGLVRYVDISPRHLFFAGRYLLRVFSRSTGKCVLDIPSTRWRYGRWRWEVASRNSNVGVGVGQGVGCDGEDEGGRDEYGRAKEEGREVVRMPVRCNFEEYSSAVNGKMVIDQFMAVHASSDGKHLVALLSGSRLVIIHHFEALLAKRPSPQPARPAAKHAVASTSNTFSPTPGAGPASTSAYAYTSSAVVGGSASTSVSGSGSGSASYSSHQGGSNPSSAAQRRAMRRARRKAREKRKREQHEKDEEIFVNTLDVQLGPPSASSSVYLTYEHGRIGVVTSNAVYVVIPTIPSSPPSPPGFPQISTSTPINKPSRPSTSSSSLSNPVQKTRTRIKNQPFTPSRSKAPQPTPPNLSILRIPYFSNPSWLSEVNCLMMSDTGLYLNWNPTWPGLGDDLGAGGGAGAVVVGAGAWLGHGLGGVNTLAGLHASVPPLGGGGAGGFGVAGVAGALENGGGPIASLAVEPVSGEEREERERMMDEWEREYERDLDDYERYEDGRYHVFPNGDMFVASAPRDLEESEISTIYRVDFAPLPESCSSAPAPELAEASRADQADLAANDVHMEPSEDMDWNSE